ncbi:DMT family transporter [Labrys monachus]|uniref:S-adenosylmethionine uptake transporter n=1 Tax=Labrys monachus TaxID=217067 RepID=A0ABU0FEV0_9HYPH|nr:DMT family transporter [Labrys monachus]MDQ0392628.1 S-adenosylmethionine uptake transporter [Labrys monachus]
MKTEASFHPVLMAGLGVTFFSFLDAVMKVITAAYPLTQAVALRYGSGTLFAVLAYLLFGDGWPKPAALRRNFLRAVIALCTAACFFTAIARLPLVEAITLTFLSPLLMALLGRLILKEPVAPRALVGILVGFAGVVVIVHGGETGAGRDFDLLGIAAALGCALFYALSMVLMRQQSAQDSIMTIVLLSNGFAFLLVMPASAWQWQPVSLSHWLMIGMAGIFGTAGNLCMAWAYARAPAGRLGIMEYSAFIWAMFFGYCIFAEIPTAWTLAGAALILAACIAATFGRARAA